MAFDPKVYRNSKDGIGSPGDTRATDASSDWTIVALLKGIWYLLSTGIATTPAVGASTEAKQDAAITAIGTGNASLSVLDDWDESDRAKVNPIVGQAGVAAGAGAVGATVQRVTLASDDPLVAALKAEDAASADGDKGFVIHAVQKATPADSAGTDGDYSPLQMSGGRLHTATAGSVASGATDSGNPVKVGAKYNATLPTFTDGQRGDIQIGTRGAVNVTLFDQNSTSALAAGGAASDAGTTTGTYLAVLSRSYSFNGSTWDRTTKPNSISRILSSAATTNATSAKAAAGNVHKVIGHNAKTSAVYLKFYNKATAPTVGTDTPVLTLYLPASTSFDIDFTNLGLYFSTGIAYGLTTDNADAGTTAVAAGDILGLNVVYS